MELIYSNDGSECGWGESEGCGRSDGGAGEVLLLLPAASSGSTLEQE